MPSVNSHPATDSPEISSELQRFTSAESLGRLLINEFARSDEPQFVVNPYSGQVLRANHAAEQFFRLPVNDLKGVYIDRLYPRHRSELYVFTEEAIALGLARTRALTLLRPDGSDIAIEHLAIALRSEDDHLFLLVRLLDLDALHRRDVNEAAESYLRKGLQAWLQDEAYFREIEREYRLILAAAGEGIYGVSTDGRTTFLNPAAEAMLGYRADELVGQDMHEYLNAHRRHR